MANTLTGLVPTIYKALNNVQRELVGLIPAVQGNQADMAGVATAAKDQTVTIPVVPAVALESITPGATPADSGTQVMEYTDITMSNMYDAPIMWEGEEEYSLGSQFLGIMQQQFEQAFRSFAAAIETDLCELYTANSRAYGTAGTTPFATDMSAMAQMRKILVDNGAPQSGLQCVIDTTAGANLRSLVQLTNVNNAGSSATLRDGILLPISGFDIRESAQIQAHTKGTATGFDANGGEPVGETTLVVDGSDSGTILAGDVVTWVGDDNKYIVQSATASGAATGNIVIAKPGMREALATTVEGTLGSSYTANMAFHRNAIVLATRRPKGGDSAVDEMVVTDPLTGLSFRLARYPQYMRNKMELQLLWGVKALKPEFMATLLG